jgi:hypothetical protein
MGTHGPPEARPRLSTETPGKGGLTPRDSARWRLFIEPDVRQRSMWRDVTTIGDVLDTPAPEKCSVRSRWYSPNREEGGIIAKTCGAKTCPVCVVPWLEKTAGRAWIAWNGGPVAVESYDTARAWKYVRETRGIKMQGADAAVGVLDLPSGDGRRVFVPGPDGLRGTALDVALIEAVRAIPVPPFKMGERKEPNPKFGLIPKWISTARAVELARQVGLEITVAGKFQVRYVGSLEDTELWIKLMRDAA